jgi:hypothetical protein
VFLDAVTVAVGSGLIFWYLVLDLAPEGTSLVSRNGAAVVGVAGLLLLVIIGKAVNAPETIVQPAVLRVLTVVPIVAVTANMLMIAGGDWTRKLLSVLTLPLIAALPRMGEAERRLVARLLDTPEPDEAQIAAVVGAVTDAGGLDYARDRAARLAQQADTELDVLPPSPARELLRASITYVLDRRR